jgi:hypothetical protein
MNIAKQFDELMANLRAQRGGFDFLGYHFERGKKWPRKKSLDKLEDAVRSKTRRNITLCKHVNSKKKCPACTKRPSKNSELLMGKMAILGLPSVSKF